MAQEFQGHTKKGRWFFVKWEEALKNFLVHTVETMHTVETRFQPSTEELRASGVFQ